MTALAGLGAKSGRPSRRRWRKDRPSALIQPSKILGIALLAAQISVAAEGPLEIYEFPSQNGIVARKAETDDQGRIIRETYYVPVNVSKMPKDENDVMPSQVREIRYDGKGNPVETRILTPDRQILRTIESSYDAGHLSATLYRDADGIVRYRQISNQGRTIADIHLDDSGMRIIAISRKAPIAEDLTDGWGNPLDGVVCGLGINRQQANLKDFRILISFKNEDREVRNVVTGTEHHVIRLELKNSKDEDVPFDQALFEERRSQELTLNNGPNENLQSLPPNEARTYTGGYDLVNWYPNLPPGKYRLKVLHRVASGEFLLESNEVQFEVE